MVTQTSLKANTLGLATTMATKKAKIPTLKLIQNTTINQCDQNQY